MTKGMGRVLVAALLGYVMMWMPATAEEDADPFRKIGWECGLAETAAREAADPGEGAVFVAQATLYSHNVSLRYEFTNGNMTARIYTLEATGGRAFASMLFSLYMRHLAPLLSTDHSAVWALGPVTVQLALEDDVVTVGYFLTGVD